MRWLVAGGGSAGTTERLYAETAKAVTERSITDVSGVLAEFDARVPSDLAFQQAFETIPVRRSWLSRYYLFVLERTKLADPEPELIPNTDVEQVNLEHVLPRNPDASWSKDFDPEQAQLMAHLLGNQCLLSKTPNDKVGNKPFAVKKPVLLASKLMLTREIGKQKAWTPASIRDRQRELAKLAVAAWKKA